MENCLSCGHSGEMHDEMGCNYNRRGAVCECSCALFISPTVMAIRELTYGDREILACALHLGVKMENISRVETTQDGGGHFNGLDIVLHIPINRRIREWVVENLPTNDLPQSKYISQEIIDWVTKRSKTTAK